MRDLSTPKLFATLEQFAVLAYEAFKGWLKCYTPARIAAGRHVDGGAYLSTHQQQGSLDVDGTAPPSSRGGVEPHTHETLKHSDTHAHTRDGQSPRPSLKVTPAELPNKASSVSSSEGHPAPRRVSRQVLGSEGAPNSHPTVHKCFTTGTPLVKCDSSAERSPTSLNGHHPVNPLCILDDDPWCVCVCACTRLHLTAPG